MHIKQKNEDLRIRRTRKLLSDALLELLETNSFEKISVIDICNKSMIHRTTFYNHFEDKNHLLLYVVDEIEEKLFSQTIEREHYENRKQMFMDLAGKAIDFVEANRNKILSIIKNNHIEKISDLILTTIEKSINYLFTKNKTKENLTIPATLLSNFFSGGITNLCLKWLLSETPYKKEDMLKYFDIILDENVYINKINF